MDAWFGKFKQIKIELIYFVNRDNYGRSAQRSENYETIFWLLGDVRVRDFTCGIVQSGRHRSLGSC